MSESYEHDFLARFDAPIAIDDDVADIASLHRILLRRTHRHYAPRPVSKGLVTLLTAAALSASSKSDFQQASIIRVLEPETRAALAALIPAMPWIGTAPVFLVFCGDARRSSALAACATIPNPMAVSKASSMPPSTRR